MNTGCDLRIERALLSVSDKTGIIGLAKELILHDVQIVSTGGTAEMLRENSIPVTEVSDVTEFPEILDGRVKTLHPKIHAGILAVHGNPEHKRTLVFHGIEKIDMVVVNLYPFREAAVRPGVTFDEVIEQIDIGGPAMIRAAAKNWESVAVVVDPCDYPQIIAELQKTNGALSWKTHWILMKRAFDLTAAYDAVIAAFLRGIEQPIQEP